MHDAETTQYYKDGQAAFKAGAPRRYGPHYGMRSTYESSKAEFYRGYDAAERESLAPQTKTLTLTAEQAEVLEALANHRQYHLDCDYANGNIGPAYYEAESAKADSVKRLLGINT